MGALVDTSKQHQFGEDKRDRLTAYCRRCPVQTFCYGGCPKDWVGVTPDGEPGLSHLCKGYKQFFTYVQPFMHAMVGVLRQRQGPLKMREAAKKVYDRLWHGVGRNDLCPCGSGRKYKKCCS